MMPLVSAPWLDADGKPLSVRPLPGLRSEVIQSLECSYPGIISPALRALLRTCCGLAGTALGSVDFTGCLHPEEPLCVFRPCITLSIDNGGRRWIAETGRENGLPGPIWCVVSKPDVAMYVSDDLSAFVATLREHVCLDLTGTWLRELSARARIIWSYRHMLASRSYEICRSDDAVRGWLRSLPFDARIFDLRDRSATRGWPYGLAGPAGQLYRCGRLPLFAVASRSAPDQRAQPSSTRGVAFSPPHIVASAAPTRCAALALDGSRLRRCA
jgi:hypothetical protein